MLDRSSCPPPLPWLTLPDGTFLSIPGGEIYHVPIPDDVSCNGSVNDWLFLVHEAGGCSLMNPFSNVVLQLPNLSTIWHRETTNTFLDDVPLYKAVVPSSTDLSQDSVVAVLITDSTFHGVLCICQPPVATDTVSNKDIRQIIDIVFFEGKLYVLASSANLFIIESSLSTYESFDERYLIVFCYYLVESDGKLLMVRHAIGIFEATLDNMLDHTRTLSFEIFEADLSTGSCRQWRKISTLGGRALFIGRQSKSLPASECGIPQEDCIYFIGDYDKRENFADPLRDSGVFNMRNGKITPLLSDNKVVQPYCVTKARPTWFYPTEAM